MADTWIFERYDLHLTPEKFYVEPLQPDGGQLHQDPCLVIDRIAHDFSLQRRAVIPVSAEKQTIYGVIGIIRLIAGPYLIVITQKELVVTINEHKIYKMTDAEIIPYSRTTLHLTENQVRENRRFISLVNQVLKTDGFYFSYTFDVTHSLQRLENTAPDFRQNPMHARADHRFLWNKHVLTDMTLQPELHKFSLPIMHGFVGMKQCRLKGHPLQLILISRRSWMRAGTRFNMRGLDEHGNSANFVETEQILVHQNNMCALVQTRGSIPLFWSQKPNLRWQPCLRINPAISCAQAFQSHMAGQLVMYPGIHVIVNLVNRKGRELRIGVTLEEAVADASMDEVRYVYFDFHKECKNMNWHRLEILKAELLPFISQFGYFQGRTDAVEDDTERAQTGYLRTNCVDCLDRTNVVQTMIGKCSIITQLQSLNLLNEGESTADWTEFDAELKNLWADNGDMLSLQYAGTGALKADFTRLGRRTLRGLLTDGYNALSRYGKNNFFDGDRQDAIDLFLGNVPDAAESMPEPQWTDWRGLVMLALIGSAAMLILSLIFSTEHTLYFGSFWLLILSALIAVIFSFGEEFVNKPKLKIE